MNSSTQGTRYYAEEFRDNEKRWMNLLFIVLALIGVAAFFMFGAFLAGSHHGAATANARWQAKFDVEVSRAVKTAKANFVGPSPKWRCDAAERKDFFDSCYGRMRGAITK
jgi:hypothetical protein